MTSLYSRPQEVFSGLMPVSRRLHARKIYLKRLSIRDSFELFHLMIDNKKWIESAFPPLPDSFSLHQVREMIRSDQKKAAQGLRLDLGIFSQQNHSLMGMIALHSVEYGVQRSAGLSYWIDEKKSGMGIMTSAMCTLLSFAFEESLLHRVWADVAVENLASSRLVQKTGFRSEGTKLESLFIDGSWKTLNHFAMLEVEYDKVADQWIKRGWLGS